MRCWYALLWLPWAVAKSCTGDRVLVVTDSSTSPDHYSQLWSSLGSRGFSLTFRDAIQGPPLFEFDQAAYDHIVLLAPATKTFSADLSPQSLFQFLSSKGNIVAALAPNASETLVSFAREFNLEFDLKSTSLIDHAFYDPSLDDGTHTLVQLPWQGSLVYYKGLAHRLPPHYPLATSFLQGTPTSYSYEVGPVQVDSNLEGTTGPVISGPRAQLVTGVQTLGNTRIAWSGSLDLLSDTYWESNSGLVDQIFKWSFQEQGVLKVDRIQHKRVGEHESRKEYQIRDDLIYSVAISQYQNDHWQPVNLPDLQLEVRLIDPYLRVPLVPAHISNAAHSFSSAARHTTEYSATFKLPDKHGVFTLLLAYKHPRLSYIEEKTIVPVTPTRHDKFPRFINSAWPFYLGAIASSGAFLAFVGIWLSLAPKGKGKTE